MNIHLVNADTLAFIDVGSLLKASLRTLNIPCTTGDAPRPDALNILFGYQFVREVPRDCRYIVYQLEQLPAVHEACWSPLAGHAARAVAIWDYDQVNVVFMKDRGIRNVRLVPLGYHEDLERIEPREPDIDILFYGWVNDRRRTILDSLGRRCTVKVLESCYGDDRHEWIARSKIVLNIHYYPASRILEQTRVAYLLNNGRTVVSEASTGHPLANCLYEAPYGGLVSACRALLSEGDWQAVGRIGHERFKRMRMVETVREALEGVA